MELVIVGTAALFVGFYLAVLEFSARARTIEELKGERRAPPGKPMRPLGIPVGELVKAAPELVTRFGKLKASAAAMIVGVALFICATAIAWKALPGGGETEPTPTTGTTPTTTTQTDTGSTTPTSTETTPTTTTP